MIIIIIIVVVVAVVLLFYFFTALYIIIAIINIDLLISLNLRLLNEIGVGYLFSVLV